MPDYPSAGVKLVADIDDYRSSMNEALQLANQFDALGDLTVTVTAEVDAGDIASEIESSLPEDTTVSVTAEVEESSELTDLENLDGEVISPEVEPETSEEGQTLLSRIHDLADIGAHAYNLIVNIAGTALDFLNAVSSFTTQPLLDLDSAVARVNAQTGNAIPNARELISGIFYDDLGKSVDEVANLVTQAQQIGAPIDEATRAALTFTHTFQDADPSQVLNTMNQLVITGLVPNFTTASDLLVTGFQEGDNRANDLLNTLTNNAGAISDMGLNGQQALSLIKTGLDGGAASAQDVLNTLIKIKTNVTAASGNSSSDVTQLLRSLGIPNPTDSGEGWSADFFTSVKDAILNAPVDDATKQQMFQTLVGGKIGAKEYSAFLNIDAADPAFDDLAGKAADAATNIDDSLSGAIDDFKLAIQEAATDFLSSEQIDLPGKIAALKTGIQDALTALQSGESLGTAFEIGLKPLGLDQIALTLENAVNDLVIGILQVVAAIQSFLGQDNTGTQQTVSGLAQGALTTQLKVNPGDAEAVAQSVDTALKRGIDPTTIGNSLEEAVSQLVASGDFKKAQDLIDSFKQVGITLNPGQDVEGTNAGINTGLANAQNLVTRGGEGLGNQSPIDAAVAALDDLAKSDTTTALDDMASAATDLTPTLRDAQQADTDRTKGLTDQKTTTDQSTISIDAMTTSTDDLAGAAADANLATSNTATSLSSLIAQEQALEAQLAAGAISLEEFNRQFANLVAIAEGGGGATTGTEAGGGTVVDTKGPFAEGTDESGTGAGIMSVGEQGQEFISTNKSLSVLNNKTTAAIMAAISGTAGRGGVTNTSSKMVNLTQINNVPNVAVADALGYKTAQQIRGA